MAAARTVLIFMPRALPVVVLLALAGCGAPPEKGEKAVSVEMLKPLTEAYREYVADLVLLGSLAPRDRLDATKRLQASPYGYFPDDRELIKKTAEGDEAARLELTRRGKILDAMFAFWGKPDTAKWNDARQRIAALGEDARVILINTFMRMLLNGQLREVWPAIRFQLIALGDDALVTASALFQRMVDETPDTIIYKRDDLVQVGLVILGFGEKGRPVLEKHSRSERFNVRRAIAVAIGEGRATERLDLLETLLRRDPEWMVRADAADAMGSIRDRDRAGATLVEALKTERDRNVRPHIATSLGSLAYADGVPILVASLEVADYDYVEKAMFALFQITGQRHMNAQAWQKWFATKWKPKTK